MIFAKTGLPQDPQIEKAFEYFTDRFDERALRVSLRDFKHLMSNYDHYRVQINAAAILAESGAEPALVSAFLLNNLNAYRQPTDADAIAIWEEFGDDVYNFWYMLGDKNLDTPLGVDSEQPVEQLMKLEHAPPPFKTAKLAFYAAAMERLLQDENLLVSGIKPPNADRAFVDGCRTLVDVFSSISNYSLQLRLEKSFAQMDSILAQAGKPPAMDR